MHARFLFYVAAAIALVGTLATCQHAKAQTNAIAAFVATLPPEVQRDTQAIRAALKRPVVTETVTNVVRATRQEENRLKALAVPALLSQAQWDNAPALRDERIDAALESGMGRAGLTDAEFLALAKLDARIALLRRRIERAGGDPTGPLAGAATAPVTVRTVGPPRWQALGLSELPSLDAIRGAGK